MISVAILVCCFDCKNAEKKKIRRKDKFVVIMELNKSTRQKDVCATLRLSASTVVTIYIKRFPSKMSFLAVPFPF